MPVLVWSDRDGILGNSIRTGRRYRLSAEEFRAEAEALDQTLDALLDMAWHALVVITSRKDGKPRFNSFEQVWALGRAIHVCDIMRHEAMQGEERLLLWQALTAKAWYGIRHDAARDPRWRELIPARNSKWQTKPLEPSAYRFLEIGYWLREQQIQDAGEVFAWKYSHAYDLFHCSSLRSVELRESLLYWLRRQPPAARDELAKAKRGRGFDAIRKALVARFPSKGPGSALLPQHYPEAELREIVCQTLDAAVNEKFS